MVTGGQWLPHGMVYPRSFCEAGVLGVGTHLRGRGLEQS